MMAGLDEFNDDKGCNRRDDVQKSRQSFEHVTRMNQGVEWKRYCHKNHPDLYNDEGSFGTEKVFPFDSSLGQKVIVELADRLWFIKEKITTFPKSWKDKITILHLAWSVFSFRNNVFWETLFCISTKMLAKKQHSSGKVLIIIW